MTPVSPQVISHSPRVELFVAPNPGPMTLEGTNTYLVDGRYLIDPGPDPSGHLDGLTSRLGETGLTAILLTHLHPDHAGGAAVLAGRLDVPVWAGRTEPGLVSEVLEENRELPVDGDRLRVVSTPGHSPEHVAFYLENAGILFAGDTVLGRGTSVIAPPEGDMAAYIDTLQRLQGLQPGIIAPGHGPVVRNGPFLIDAYLSHRREREEQVVRALGAGPLSVEGIVQAVYGDIDPALHLLAAASTSAQLTKLVREGRVMGEGDEFRLVSPRS